MIEKSGLDVARGRIQTDSLRNELERDGSGLYHALLRTGFRMPINGEVARPSSAGVLLSACS